MISLSPAQASDTQQLLALTQAYVGDIEYSSTYEGLLEYLQNSNDIVYVAEDKGVIIGYCCGRISHHMSFNKPIADILELYLAEDYRGSGLGRQLLAAMDAEFTSRGVNRTRVFVRESSENARKFYEACGYEGYPMVMYRKDI